MNFITLGTIKSMLKKNKSAKASKAKKLISRTGKPDVYNLDDLLDKAVIKPLPVKPPVVSRREVAGSLKQVYQDDAGRIINPKKMEIKHRVGFWGRWLRRLLWLILLLGIGAAVAYGVSRWETANNPTDFNLTITADPQQVAVGQDFFVTIDYQNLDRAAIKNLQLHLLAPDGWQQEDSQPAGIDANNWQFDQLAQKASGEIKLKGKMLALASSTVNFSVQAAYQPTDFSSQFTKNAQTNVNLTTLGVNLMPIAPSAPALNQDLTLIVDYDTQPINYLTDCQLQIDGGSELAWTIDRRKTWPSGMTGLLSPGVWGISSWPTALQTFAVHFQYLAFPPANQPLTVSLLAKGLDGKYYKVYSQPLNFAWPTGQLSAALQVENNPVSLIANPGQTLTYALTVGKPADMKINNATVSVFLDNNLVDWPSIIDTHGSQQAGNALTWDLNDLPELQTGANNTTSTINFTVRLKPMTALLNLGQNQFVSQAKFVYDFSTAESPTSTVSAQLLTNPVTIYLGSDLSAGQTVKYFNSDNLAVGSGPIPPVVNQQSTVKVYWQLSNSWHSLSDVLMSVVMPAEVNFANGTQTTAGNISYDNASRRVSWNIGAWPASSPQINGEFSVTLSPSAADAGKLMIVVPTANVSAQDNQIKQTIKLTAPAKTSKLEDDPNLPANDGLVKLK